MIDPIRDDSLLFTLTAPSKSFFVGEYLALGGGPALLAATEPRFELRVSKGAGALAGIPERSPAGRWIGMHGAVFRDLDLEFIDPHAKVGGWGGSGAQFLTCYAALEALVHSESVGSGQRIDVYRMLQAYAEVAWEGRGMPPSGADLVAQLKGGLVEFGKTDRVLRNHLWPFDDLEFYFVATGHKVATHEHLRQITNIDSRAFSAHATQVSGALRAGDAAQLVNGINGYARELNRQSLVHEKTLELLDYLNSLPGVLGCKGCGALGADVVLTIVQASASKSFESLMERRLATPVGRRQLSGGLTIENRSRQ